MIVEPFGYPIDNMLVRKLDLMAKRCTQQNPKRDVVLTIEGAESEGKTSMSVGIGFYISQITGRQFNDKNVFFDLTEMMKFLQETEEQIIIWDEPAISALSTDTFNRLTKDLKRLLIMARKKRHFIMINIAYFSAFQEYLVWQRPVGMVHVYSRNEIEAGRFSYIPKRRLEGLWKDWRYKKMRNYKKWSSKLVRGTFADVLNPDYKHNVLSSFNLSEYERRKDAAIKSIGEEKKKPDNPDKIILKKLRLAITKIKFPVNSRLELTKKMGIGHNELTRWAKEYSDDNKDGDF